MKSINRTRVIYFIFLIGVMLSVILPCYFSIQLINLHDYDSFYGLLDNPFIEHMYVTRVIVANLNYTSFSLMKVLYCLVSELSIMNLIILLLVAYLWAARYEYIMKKRKQVLSMVICLFCLMYSAIAIIIIFGFQISNVYAIMAIFKNVGYVMFLGHVLLFLVSGYSIIKEIKKGIYAQS